MRRATLVKAVNLELGAAHGPYRRPRFSRAASGFSKDRPDRSLLPRPPSVMGETPHAQEDPVRTNYNRQTRRAAHCIKARSPRGHESAIAPRRAALRPHGDDLAQVAARIAQELELSADVIDNLLGFHQVCEPRTFDFPQRGTII